MKYKDTFIWNLWWGTKTIVILLTMRTNLHCFYYYGVSPLLAFVLCRLFCLHIFVYLQPMSNGANHAPPFTMPPPPQFPGQQKYTGGGAIGSYPATTGGSFGPPPLPSQPPNAVSGSGPPHIPFHPPAGSVPPPGFYDPQNTPDTAVCIVFLSALCK